MRKERILETKKCPINIQSIKFWLSYKECLKCKAIFVREKGWMVDYYIADKELYLYHGNPLHYLCKTCAPTLEEAKEITEKLRSKIYKGHLKSGTYTSCKYKKVKK